MVTGAKEHLIGAVNQTITETYWKTGDVLPPVFVQQKPGQDNTRKF